jgi:Sec-independent protein translocase protein TatA
MKQLKKVISIFFSKLLGLLIFLIILGILNIVSPFINQEILTNITLFLNSNFILILLFSLFFTVAEMLFALVFPLNLPAPLFSSFGSIFLITFLFNIANFINITLDLNLTKLLNFSYLPIIFIVFIIVFITGYTTIFSKGVEQTTKGIKHIHKAWKTKKSNKNKTKEEKNEDKKEKEKFKKIPSKKSTLKDVKEEIKNKKNL